jgi:hypothetical protein
MQVVVLPFAFAFVLATDSGLHARLAKLLGVIAEAGFLYVFWRLGDFFPILRGRHELLSIEGAVARLGLAGVTTAAILSGASPVVRAPQRAVVAVRWRAAPRDVRMAMVALPVTNRLPHRLCPALQATAPCRRRTTT